MKTSFDWMQFSESDKGSVRGLRATFVMAPRELSEARLVQLVKEHLVTGNVVFGVAKEVFVAGFDGQPQFRMLGREPVARLAEKINAAKLPYTLSILSYPQAKVDEVIRAVRPSHVVVVRGSYLYAFHRGTTYALLEKRSITFEYASPFTSETEALEYLKMIEPALPEVTLVNGGDLEMMHVVTTIAKRSFDYGFQTGAVLAEKTPSGYTVVDAACNEVVPYQTYAMQFGNARETHLVVHQGNAAHYDTIHAEMNLLVRASLRGQSLKDLTLFINMMPCPNCARTLVGSGLKELVYNEIHSDGYAVELFEKAGIKTRKVDL